LGVCIKLSGHNSNFTSLPMLHRQLQYAKEIGPWRINSQYPITLMIFKDFTHPNAF
jgi:hypothetical protein